MSRSKRERAVARRLLNKPAGALEPVDLAGRAHPAWMSRAFANHRYVVMIADQVPLWSGMQGSKVMVQRHDDQPIPGHWRELQMIKNALFGREATAVEFYPPESELIYSL
ncbi:hypothetical protein [uncultured Lamprocystis sp.]|jgi:hypothetical protein|uniref:DUF7694 domain-containing protein n=1 Tax=uncultured Lamprocystis sp. TaxID=543132 RepID=UPI0025CC7248|nr:hypothetical protein [uncultured Lamprocystis sp.]